MEPMDLDELLTSLYVDDEVQIIAHPMIKLLCEDCNCCTYSYAAYDV